MIMAKKRPNNTGIDLQTHSALEVRDLKGTR